MSRKIVFSVLGVLVVAAVFFLDPFGFLSPKFDYDGGDMRAAVEGTWHLKVGDRDLVLAISQGGAADVHARRTSLMRNAEACGTRSLIRSAEACIDATQMPLHVVLTAQTAGVKVRDVSGQFRVFSTRFKSGELELSLDGPDDVVEATVTPGGAVSRVSASGPGAVALEHVSKPAAPAR